jgi:hypothetical protein
MSEQTALQSLLTYAVKGAVLGRHGALRRRQG